MSDISQFNFSSQMRPECDFQETLDALIGFWLKTKGRVLPYSPAVKLLLLACVMVWWPVMVNCVWKFEVVSCIFVVVVFSGDHYQFFADTEREKVDWMQVLQDASRISVKSETCCLLLWVTVTTHWRLCQSSGSGSTRYCFHLIETCDRFQYDTLIHL